MEAGRFLGHQRVLQGVPDGAVTKPNDTGGEVYDHTELHDNPTGSHVSYDKRNGMVGIAFPRFLDGRKISQGTDVDPARRPSRIAHPKNERLAEGVRQPEDARLPRSRVRQPGGRLRPHDQALAIPEVLDQLAKDFRDPATTSRLSAGHGLATSSAACGEGSEKDEGRSPRCAAADESLSNSSTRCDGDVGPQAAGGGRRQLLMQRLAAAIHLRVRQRRGRGIDQLPGDDPQALMMMNGELMQEALAELSANMPAVPADRPRMTWFDSTTLAALSAHFSARELSQARKYLTTSHHIEVLEDLFWALLNSNEFILIH